MTFTMILAAAVCAMMFAAVGASPFHESALDYFAEASSMSCNYNAHYSTTIGGTAFNLNGCLKSA